LPSGSSKVPAGSAEKIPDKGKSSQPPRAKDVNRSLDERLLPIGHGEKKENCSSLANADFCGLGIVERV
jgi:hypothetical protein